MPTSVQILERLLKCVACYARALSLPLKVYAMEQVKETMTFVYRLKEHPRRESGTTYKVLPKATPTQKDFVNSVASRCHTVRHGYPKNRDLLFGIRGSPEAAQCWACSGFPVSICF